MASLKAGWQKYTLHFKRPSGTSRGVLTDKNTWFLLISRVDQPNVIGIGECGPLKGLSFDDRPDFEAKLTEVCLHIEEYQDTYQDALKAFPAIQFGLESALLDLQAFGPKILFPSSFTEGKTTIDINGLIWMGSREYMHEQIETKLAEGFTCLKMKIGTIDFEQELSLLKEIRREYSAKEVELRVDANGAFSPQEALEKLKRLAELELHSIEQPIQVGQIDLMANLCETTPLPIALDEELIGVTTTPERINLLSTIKPQYIILKPTLVGGFKNAEEWISLANKRNIPWWITSALESNIGLNGIAQWTATLDNALPQGLGTGQLYTNNIPSPLVIQNGTLCYDRNKDWDISKIESGVC
ncbi:MAG: o-succinylbenzoate synthase [Gammaproteobacteria bacterium]|nr:MAG: o-succinylbenzoate synthase [Gammaproteobacteria bacterium]